MRLLPIVTLGELVPAAYQWATSSRATGVGRSVKACIPISGKQRNAAEQTQPREQRDREAKLILGDIIRAKVRQATFPLRAAMMMIWRRSARL